MSRLGTPPSRRTQAQDRVSETTRLALVGAGLFGRFILQAASDVPQVEALVVADTAVDRADQLAAELGCRAATVEEALASSDTDAVVIATPPHTHADLAMAALHAGKDVFCEKPLGMTADQAAQVRELAESLGRVVVVDHVLRYNPLLHAIRRLQDRLGLKPIRFLFENDAADESLARDHWFWDDAVSGGIFVEHGVHFFDAAAMFVGEPPTSVAAVATSRAGWPSADLVTATVTHGDCLATHTHSFTHAHRCERQLMRIDYGSAEARIAGWIPIEAVIDLHLDPSGESEVRALLTDAAFLGPDARRPTGWDVRIESREVGGDPQAIGRGERFGASRRVMVRLTLGGEGAKQSVYAASVAAALADLHACRVDPVRQPLSGARTAEAAVVVARCATRAAALGRAVSIPTMPLSGSSAGRSRPPHDRLVDASADEPIDPSPAKESR
jgi:predicted dehydrogenase